MLQSFQHFYGITVKIRKNQIFHRFFDFLPWSRNNYVMIPITWWFPVNFTPKNYTSKLNFEEKKIFDPPKGSQVRSQNGKTTILGCRTDFFFLWKKKLTIVFFEVKFTGDYRNVAIISTLFGITVQIRKNRIFHRFFEFSRGSRNNYVMIPKTW